MHSYTLSLTHRDIHTGTNTRVRILTDKQANKETRTRASALEREE